MRPMLQALILLLKNPQVLIAIFGVIGSILGWWAKRWLAKEQARTIAAETQKAEQDLANALTKQEADRTAKVNHSIDLQDQAESNWKPPVE